MTDNSFTFDTVNSVDEWGLKVMRYDVVLPPKKPRKIVIPFRDGQYDYGARNYDDRILSLKCTWINSEPAPRAKLREIAYHLSKKGKITLFDEPDKFYTGEVYDPAALDVLANGKFMEFTLAFICEPFVKKIVPTQKLQIGENVIDYQGTAPTRPLIVIKNNGTRPIQNVYLTTISEKG